MVPDTWQYITDLLPITSGEVLEDSSGFGTLFFSAGLEKCLFTSRYCGLSEPQFLTYVMGTVSGLPHRLS